MQTLIVASIVFIVVCLFVVSALFRKLSAVQRPVPGQDDPTGELADKLDSSGISDDAKRQLLEQMDPETATDIADQRNADAAVARDIAHLGDDVKTATPVEGADPKPSSGPDPHA